MMNGFPPPPDQQVTWANWRSPPHNRWGVQHLREIMPSAIVDVDPDRLWALPRAQSDLGRVAFTAYDGRERSLDSWIQEGFIDGYAVLSRGAIVYERYLTGMTPASRHLVFSVTKSVTGLLLGVLADQGLLDVEAPVSAYIPEAKDSGFGDASVRQVLDMQTSLDYDEDYSDPRGLTAKMREASGFAPPSDPLVPSDLRSFLLGLGRRPGPHGKRFRYLTPNSDLLGWICERATGVRFADLLSRHLWQPMGAERSADIALDRLGAARSGGGLCVTLRDLARLGELVRCHGVADGRQVVPAWWIDDIFRGGSRDAWAGSDFEYFLPGGAYRSQWYLSDARGTKFYAAGIHGQWIYGNRDRDVVIAVMSSHPQASSTETHNDLIHLACFDAIAASLSN